MLIILSTTRVCCVIHEKTFHILLTSVVFGRLFSSSLLAPWSSLDRAT